MPFTPPVTFSNATVLEAGDINDNLDELDAFLSLGVTTSTELEDDSVSASKILRPRTLLVSDRVTSTYFETGSVHHARLPALDYISFDPLTGIPFQSSGFLTQPYHDAGPGYLAYRPVPGTWISYYAQETPMAVLIRFMGEVLVPADHTGSAGISSNYILAAHESDVARESTCRIKEMTTLLTNFDRRHVAGCALFTSGLSAGWHHIGLVAGLTSNFGLIGGFEITVEVFH